MWYNYKALIFNIQDIVCFLYKKHKMLWKYQKENIGEYGI